MARLTCPSQSRVCGRPGPREAAPCYDAAPYYCGGPETLDYPANQEECVVGISYNFACQEKVADYENCTLSEVPTHGCNTSAPECGFECFMGDAGFGP